VPGKRIIDTGFRGSTFIPPLTPKSGLTSV